jgi:hypothetical protein
MRNYLVLAILALVSIAAHADTFTYSLSGTISDPSEPALDGQWVATMTLDTTTAPFFDGTVTRHMIFIPSPARWNSTAPMCPSLSPSTSSLPATQILEVPQPNLTIFR